MRKLFKNKNLKYNLMYVGMKIGVVSKKRWHNYTNGILIQLLNDNKNVFKRLKEM